MNIRRSLPASDAGSAPATWLEARRVRSYEAQGDGSLRCLTGHCWVTRTGDPRDYLLQPGEEYPVTAGESLTVQALDTASLVVSGALVERSAGMTAASAHWAREWLPGSWRWKLWPGTHLPLR